MTDVLIISTAIAAIATLVNVILTIRMLAARNN